MFGRSGYFGSVSRSNNQTIGANMAEKNNVVDFPVPADASAAEVMQTIEADNRENTEKKSKTDAPAVALALGGGAARGWAHIGVMRAIDEAGIPVSMIAGTSIGALVGGCYLAGKLDELEEFARSISRWNVLRYMDFAVRASGLISGKRLADRMDTEIGDLNIEDLDRRFVAIATDVVSGSELWLEHGSLSDAIRASYALPGVFQPVKHLGRQMVDGALVNPVPVSACRAFEAPIVVAVYLNSLVLGRASVVRSTSLTSEADQVVDEIDTESDSWLGFIKGAKQDEHSRLGVAGVMIEAFNIIQDRIARSRLAGDPPDVTIRPNLSGIGLSDFHKAGEAIDRGYEMGSEVLRSIENKLSVS